MGTTGQYTVGDVGIANAYRRACLGDIPTMAVDSVRIHENTSQMADEVLAHRIGLLPLEGDASRFRTPSECECPRGCARCECSLRLDVQAPPDRPRGVSSTDVQGTADVRTSAALGVVDLVKLPPGRRIRLTAVARRGTGRAHSRWCKVCSVGITESLDKKAVLTIETDGSTTADVVMEEARVCLASRLADVRRQVASFSGRSQAPAARETP